MSIPQEEQKEKASCQKSTEVYKKRKPKKCMGLIKR
jgi:hypothetical protein